MTRPWSSPIKMSGFSVVADSFFYKAPRGRGGAGARERKGLRSVGA
mgnify:CR=1 FL=1